MPELATDKVFPNRKIGGITYTVVVRPMGFEVQSMLWDLMSNVYSDRAGRQGADTQLGRTRDAVLYNGIKKLEVEGKEYAMRGDYALADLPKYADREYMRKMPDRLLEHVVEVNDFLGFEDPFSGIFGRYLSEELREELRRQRNTADPTNLGGESQEGSQDTPQGDEQSGEATSTSEPTPGSAPSRIPSMARQ